MNRKQRRQNKTPSAPPTSKSSTPELDAAFKHGRELMDNGDLASATAVFANIMKQKPEHLEAVEQMAICALKLKKHDTALNFFHVLKQVKPQETVKWDAYIGCAYGELDRYDEAIPLLEKAYETIKLPEIQGTLAVAYFQKGDFEKGRIHIEESLKQAPDNLINLNIYANQLVTFTSEDDPFFLRLKAFEKPDKLNTLNTDEKAHLYFALFKAYNDLKQYETAFNYALEGAKHKREIVRYNHAAMMRYFNTIQTYFSASFLKEHKSIEGHPSEAPVFVLAMPRSGTTLLEQILNAHPKIAGIGEDVFLYDTITKYAAPPVSSADAQKEFPFGWIQKNDKLLSPTQIGEQYISHITKKCPDAQFVVNKAIGTYQHVGYINLALPNAKLIHIKRNAMDSCISTFTKLFSGQAQEYSYDLTELGERYRLYTELMDHWIALFPDKILHVDYEELVRDTEGQTKRILDFIGAPWDPACMKFYEQNSIVKTASIEQVRKPIYTSAIGRWKRYGNKISPLIKALGDAAPSEAKDYLAEIK